MRNETTGWYKDHEAIVKPAGFRRAEGRLGIKAPAPTWTGDSARRPAKVEAPRGSLGGDLSASG